MLVHDDGVVVPELEKIYKNQVAHDPHDLDAARRIAGATDRVHLGVLFRDGSQAALRGDPARAAEDGRRARGPHRSGARPICRLIRARARRSRRSRSRSPSSASLIAGRAHAGRRVRRRAGRRRATRRPRRRGAELGEFAAGRIDAGRVRGAVSGRAGASIAARSTRCGAPADVLRAVARPRRRAVRGRRAARRGGSAPRWATRSRRVGRAFGAVMLTEVVRGGRYRRGAARPAARARRVPRMEQGGAPVRAAARHRGRRHATCTPAPSPISPTDARSSCSSCAGACGPAPLARCITPGTLVLQTVDGAGLDRVAAFDGPAVAAHDARGRGGVRPRSARRAASRGSGSRVKQTAGAAEARDRRHERVPDGRGPPPARRPRAHAVRGSGR